MATVAGVFQHWHRAPSAHSTPHWQKRNKKEKSEKETKGALGLTLKRTEASVHDQLQIAELALRQGDSGQLLGLGDELVMARSIAGEKVLEDASVGWVGHCCGSRTSSLSTMDTEMLDWTLERPGPGDVDWV